MITGVVYTDGTWDLLHYNHIEMLRQCLDFGDKLVVGVVSDAWVETYKRRPVLSEAERLRGIRSLGFVSEAFVLDGPFTADLMSRIINLYRPVAVVYGSSGFDEYYKPAEDLGIMRRLPYRPGISTSEIVNRILCSHGRTPG